MKWTRLNNADNEINVVIIKAQEGEIDCAGFVVSKSLSGYNIILADVSEDDAVANYSQVKNIAIKKLKKGMICFLKYENLSDYEAHEIYLEQSLQMDFKSIINCFAGEIGAVFADIESVCSIGGWNESLNGAEDYELLCRAGEYELTDKIRACILKSNSVSVYEEDYYTYAYVLARFLKPLQQAGLWEKVLEKKVLQAQQYGMENTFAGWLELMLTNHEEYKKINSNAPILVLMGEQMCFGVLDEFAVSFAYALKKNNQPVILYDAGTVKANINEGGRETLYKLANRHYSAVVGFQTSIFAEEMPDGNILGNIFDCPKYQFIFDHPLYISYYLMLPIKEYYVLAQDAGYARYVEEYYDNIAGAYHFPPAGQLAEKALDKIYDLTFVASYHDYRKRLSGIRSLPKKRRQLALKLINLLKHNPHYSMEDGLKKVLMADSSEEANAILCDKRKFIVTLHHMSDAGRIIMFYYRENIIQRLLESGVALHVFSDTWKDAPFADNERLHIHPDVSYKEGLEIMSQSRMTLNIMSWHKEGMTERIANSMLNRAVCVTDTTLYLKKHFTDGKDIVFFELDNIEQIIGKINMLLENKAQLNEIAENAYEKALKNHTWDKRAEEFEQIRRAGND